MPRGRHRLILDMATFRQDVDSGTPTLTLAEKYGVAKSTIWKLKAELSGKIARGELRQKRAAAPAAEQARCFELHIDLAEEAIDEVLRSLSDTELRTAVLELESQDKATIVQLALQRKLNGFAQPNPAETETDNAEARPDPS